MFVSSYGQSRSHCPFVDQRVGYSSSQIKNCTSQRSLTQEMGFVSRLANFVAAVTGRNSQILSTAH